MLKLNSAKKFIDDIAMGEDLKILHGDFLDEFYRSNTKTQQCMIDDEPRDFNNVDVLQYANIAATVHKLANDFKLNVPKWVFKSKYYLKEPYFPIEHWKLRAIYAFESPSEFKHRNIFVSANTMSRV
ncbi:MAG: hypothetical protein RR504_00915 [Christensenellaceae bacterium]